MDQLFEELKRKAAEKNKGSKVYTSLKNGLNVHYYPRYIEQKSCTSWFNWLEKNINFPEQTEIKIMGKTVPIPRLQIAYGDDNITYTYSGKTVDTLPWPKTLIRLKNIVEILSDQTYNFVLINKYRNGKDYVGFHRDAEKDLDPTAPIASISFGASRDFVLKNIKNDEKITIALNNGDILFMNYPTNICWKHSVPKRETLNDIRYNLTFRKIKKN
jgi:alpha-ketoglutarate-dependent dioxygenase alkB family protein 2